jgi:hypothetical protein
MYEQKLKEFDEENKRLNNKIKKIKEAFSSNQSVVKPASVAR